MVLKALIILGLVFGSAAKHKGKHHGGEANIKTVWKLAKIEKQLNNVDIGSGILDKLFPEEEGLFAPTISCAQHTTSSARRYDLHDVPYADCNEAAKKAWMGLHVTELTYEDVFADEAGKAVIARVMFQGNLVGGPPVSFPCFGTYTFDDAGKITSVKLDMDSTPLTPNARNIQTVWKLAKVMSGLNNADIGSGIIAKLFPEFEGFFAPKVSCAQHTTSKLRRYDLHDVPLVVCNEAVKKAWMGTHIVDMTFEDVFADESGTAVMARVMFQGNLPSGPPVRFPFTGTYHFDDAGKITSYRYEMDSTPLTPTARNTQTLWQVNKVMNDMNDATMDAELIAKVLPEFEMFFTKTVSCAQHASSKTRSYDLQDVPLSDCMAADGVAWAGVHLTDVGFASVFADDSGTVLLARMDFKGNDAAAQVHFPVFYTYTFDSAGKITSYMADMDSSSLPAPPTPPELAEQYAIAPSSSIAIIFLVGFIAAALVTGGIAFLVSKPSRRDALLNVYSAI